MHKYMKKTRFTLPDYQTLAFWLLTLSLCLLPIGFGGNRAIPLGMAQGGLGLCAACLALSPRTGESLVFFGSLRIATTLIATTLLWSLIQTLPMMPPGWTHPVWQEAVQALHRDLSASISITPMEDLRGALRLATILMAGLLSYIVMQKPDRALLFVQTLWRSGLIICLYGLVEHLLGLHKILWLDKWAYRDDLTATFINHNHFALYADIILLCGLALMTRSWRRTFRSLRPHQRLATWQSWLARRGLPYMMGVIVVLGCIVASHSRAGLVLGLIGMGLYGFFYALYLKQIKHAALWAITAVATLLLAVFIMTQASEHFAVLFKDYSSRDRWTVDKITLQGILENPWLGYGLGGFQPVFRTHQQFMIMDFDHAHNDVLEAVLDLGIPAALMLFIGVGILLWRLWMGVLQRRRHGLYPVLALSASLILLAHACVDFSLQIPGLSLLWAGLLGCGLAQSWGETSKEVAYSASITDA